jgi:hypothetical protein
MERLQVPASISAVLAEELGMRPLVAHCHLFISLKSGGNI